MTTLKNYEGNVLEITNEQVAENWHLGMLRACGQLIAKRPWIMHPSTLRGMRLFANPEASAHFRKNACSIVSVTSMEESSVTVSEYGEVEQKTVLTAIVNCACGHISGHPAQVNFTSGEIVERIFQQG